MRPESLLERCTSGHFGRWRQRLGEIARPIRTARQLQGQGRDQGEAGEVPHRQVRAPSDEPDQEAAGGRDVALRGAQKALPNECKLVYLVWYWLTTKQPTSLSSLCFCVLVINITRTCVSDKSWRDDAVGINRSRKLVHVTVYFWNCRTLEANDGSEIILFSGWQECLQK